MLRREYPLSIKDSVVVRESAMWQKSPGVLTLLICF
jgi:hypothetical protein